MQHQKTNFLRRLVHCIFVALIFQGYAEAMGCGLHTQVHTSSGAVEIGQLRAGQSIMAVQQNGALVETTVLAVARFQVSASVHITIGDNTTVLAPFQKMYVADENCWKPAALLRTGQLLQSTHGKPVVVDAVTYVHGMTNVVALYLDHTHTFCISSNQILVHNDLGVAVSTIISSLFGTLAAPLLHVATLVLGGLMIVALLTGIDIIPAFIKRMLAKENFYQISAAQVDGILGKLVEEEKKKGKKPPGPQLIYEVSPCHWPVPLAQLRSHIEAHACGRKSPCPPQAEGQAILEFLSFAPPGERHRIAYVAGILIFFSFTRIIPQGILYHGHYHLEPAHNLKESFFKTLIQEKIINGKGKFIK